MRSFLPGQESFRWLIIIVILSVSFVGAYGYFRSGTDAPEAAPTATAAPPAEIVPPVFATIPGPTLVRTEAFTAFSSRMAPIDPPLATAAAVSPPVVPEGPAAAPAPKTSARCARAIYRMPAIKRDSIFDDMDTKYEAARTAANRRFAAHEKCMRENVPNKGG